MRRQLFDLLSAGVVAASVFVFPGQAAMSSLVPTHHTVAAVGNVGDQRRPLACATNLAQRLRTTDGAAQLITVEADSFQTSVAEVSLWRHATARAGRRRGPVDRAHRRERFLQPPSRRRRHHPHGYLPDRRVVYGNAPNPGFRGPYHRLVCGDWWDEDPTSSGYNTFQHMPCGASPPFGGDSEALWTETTYYPSFAVVEYNSHPVVPYAGSAIFVHADTGSATTGCVSIPLSELDVFLRWLDLSRLPTIAMAPASELASF